MNINRELFEALSPRLRISDDDRLENVRQVVERGADINSENFFPVHIAVQNGWLKILKYFVENPSVELELRNEDGKTVIDLVKRKLKDKKQEDRHEYAEIFRRAEPCGFRKMENAHIRMKMVKKYESSVFCLLEMAGRTKLAKSNFKIGREVKTRETINQKFDDVVFCYEKCNKKKFSCPGKTLQEYKNHQKLQFHEKK
ncbi:hypothetical protein QYM36_002423 [Artemia franciscana]|uniref:Uncharacterized protein n=1 Tax=Artemia franciscana TaxID=6661 RepID=A0AA88LJF1_ARTSF|nr:hypothetical protein QYM36_002423 [Artemia franciscana]